VKVRANKEITDKDRLDFMGEGPRELLCFYDGYAVGFTLDGTHATISNKIGPTMPTVREAIDAAMDMENRK
jgi:hypothetical protein